MALTGCQAYPVAAMQSDAMPAMDATLVSETAVSELYTSELNPPLEILPAGVDASMTPTRAHLTSVGFGRMIEKYSLRLVRTKDGSIYQIRRDGSVERIESSYGGGYFDPQIKDLTFNGQEIIMAAVIKEFDRSHMNGHYLGLWPTKSGSVVGTFSLVKGRATPVIPLFTSKMEIQHIDFQPSPDGPSGVISIVRKRKSGQAELIDLSIMITRLYKPR